MLGLQSFPKASLIAATLVLSLGATAAYADVAQQVSIARSGHVSVQATSRAQYLSPAPSNAASGGKCVGGYQWMQRSFNVHRTENQMALPMPCH